LLSSGELRKLQITKALLSNPKVLIIDNPFIGLDVTARQQFKDLLSTLASETELMVILVLSKIDDIPDFITHVVCVEDKTVGNKISLDEYKQNCRIEYSNILTEEKRNAVMNLPYSDSAFEATQYSSMKKVIEFKDVTIKYGNRTILNKLNLSVNCGDRIALSGENGAGKSTLLSIVCADNLQAYANKIVLFDRTRGTGESIWEIKKHIGYISPEMHRSYMKDIASIEIVASGLSDSIGLYHKPKASQIGQCEFWMNIFGIEHLRDRTFLTLSSGEQRLVLLARAFVKDPSLLILDEPMHGLDMKNRQLVKEIIETFCRRKGKTLIIVSHYEDELPDCITNKVYLKRHH
jgi:molybdate transport system ATP-binding protein